MTLNANTMLEVASESEEEVSMNGAGDEGMQFNRALYLILTQITKAKALDIVKGTPRGSGFEAYRCIRVEYVPKTANRTVAMLQGLLAVTFKEVDFLSTLTKWENDCRNLNLLAARWTTS